MRRALRFLIVRVRFAGAVAGLIGAVLVPVAVLAAGDGGNASGTPSTDPMLARPCARPARCYQTWTLTSRLGHILETYEARVGASNPAYRLLGVEFTTSARPRIWYPDFGKGPRNIIIQLTGRARREGAMALFQLGHEAFHVIEPVKPNSRGSFLEEGLASYFAMQYLEAQGFERDDALLSETHYRQAYDLVRRIATLHADFDARLRRLRAARGSFSELTADDIRAHFPAAPAAVAHGLAERFPIYGAAGNPRHR